MDRRYNKYSFRILSLIFLLFMAGIVLIFSACDNSVTPRPRGYFRITPYPAQYSTQHLGNIVLQVNDSALCHIPQFHTPHGVHWLDIIYPRYDATIHLSYIPISNNLDRLMHESMELVYRQNVNTEQVEAIAYEAPEERLYATLFALSTESATPIQFIATDSSHYLLRGALHFNTQVKADSVAPALHYIETDIIQLIESIQYH